MSVSGPGSCARSSDAIAFANALVAAADSLHDPIGAGEQQTTFAAAEAVRDRYPSVSSSRRDGDLIAIGNAIEAHAELVTVGPVELGGARAALADATANVPDVKFVPGATDFPATPQTAPDNRVERALKQGPQVIPYLSQGMTSADVVGARPDDRADRFAHSDVSPRPQMATASGSTINWDNALMAAIGGLVLVLGLGLALGYLRRPRLAGL